MKNVTLSIDEETLAAGRAYAARHHTTRLCVTFWRARFTTIARRLSRNCFGVMDGASGHSRGERRTRDELYARR